MNRNIVSYDVSLFAKLLIIFMILIVIFAIFTTVTSAKGNIYIDDRVFVPNPLGRIQGSGNIIFGHTIIGPIGIATAFFFRVYFLDGNLWVDSDGSDSGF